MIGILYKIFILKYSLVFNKSQMKIPNHTRKSKFQNAPTASECIFLSNTFQNKFNIMEIYPFLLGLRIFIFEACYQL